MPGQKGGIRTNPGLPNVKSLLLGHVLTRLRGGRPRARLDEPFYATTPPIDDLIQAVPVAGGVPSERTEIWIGFDDENLYVAARIWHSGGEAGWIANEMRRDAAQLRSNDHFGIYFDTYLDRRNALGFFVSPIGGFADLQVTNEGSPNFDWNPVWDLATGRFDGGWTVEMAIPFKSLRYRPGVEQVWGIQMYRSVLRDNEWSYLTRVPIQAVGAGPYAIFRVAMYGDLVGLEVPPVGRNIEVKPFATSRLSTDRVVSPAVENELRANAGLDVKYALTQNLTFDLTANADFAQVEVDEQQVNLTRFSLSFPEKRDFFLEGRGVFNFGSGGFTPGGGGGGGGGGPTLFYSRRIGLQGGDPLQVLGGARLNGKVGAFDVGALSMQTAEDEAIGAESTNFTILRVRRDVLSRSGVGVLFQNRSRSLVAPGSSSQAWGVDANLGFTADLNLLATYACSHVRGLEGNDQSYRARLGYDADRYGLGLDALVVGNAFNPEVGLVRRRDLRQGSVSARFRPRPASIGWIRQLSSQTNLGYLENDRTRTIESRDRGARSRSTSRAGTASRPASAIRTSGSLAPSGSRDAHPGRKLRLPGLPGELPVRLATPLAGERELPMGRLLRRGAPLGRDRERPGGGQPAPVGRAESGAQLAGAPAGGRPPPLRTARGADARDLHDDAPRLRERARPVQLGERQLQCELPPAMGVGPGEPALPRLYGGPRHGYPRALVGAVQPGSRAQGDAAVPALGNAGPRRRNQRRNRRTTTANL